MGGPWPNRLQNRVARAALLMVCALSFGWNWPSGYVFGQTVDWVRARSHALKAPVSISSWPPMGSGGESAVLGPFQDRRTPSATDPHDALPRDPRASVQAELGRQREATAMHRQVLGATSCAAASCHGGPRPGIADETARRGAEFSLWRQNDPHARAHQSLCSPLGINMLRKLNILQEDRIVDQDGYQNCLRCHNTVVHDADPCCGSPIREGVGCEACHGPSELWIDRHYARNGNPAYEADNGFVPLKDLVVRARICAQCHVGDHDRDMNHDLIAAGHPALYFEFASHHARLPKHWREDGARDPRRFESQLWFAGQVASLDAALELLESRASRSSGTGTWPEFAEYQCASCHQELRIMTLDAGRVAGDLTLPRYSTWHLAGVHMLLLHQSSQGQLSAEGAVLRQHLDQLQTAMQPSLRADAGNAVNAARAARESLHRWLDEQADWRRDWNAVLLRLMIEGQKSTDASSSWEAATQLYLAAVAGRAAWPGGVNGPARKPAMELRDALSFAPGRESASIPPGLDSCPSRSRRGIAAILESLSEALAESELELQ